MFIATHLIGFAGGGANETVYRVEASTSDINAFTLFGSPVSAGAFRLIIQSGVTVSATSTGTAALTTGSFPTGSTLIIENLGTIKGKGGSGGGRTVQAFASTGGSGGNAISLGSNVTIDNTSGNIWGGGGGGGGGGYGSSSNSLSWGGAGGNGAGPDAATAGEASSIQSGDFGESPNGGSGGAGGDYGAAGSSGGSASVSGGSGGAAGKAIALNTYTVTWLGGNNGTQVKGAVS